MIIDKDTERIVGSFFDEPMAACESINTSHGDDDFREALIITFVSGKKVVIKLADNSFTSPDRIRVWQKCAADYRRLGYYAPEIYSDKAEQFPVLSYKGHTCVVYAEEFSKYAGVDAGAKGLSSSKYFTEALIMTAKIAALHSDYADCLSGYCLFGVFAPDEEEDEVMSVAREWMQYAQTLPAQFQPQVKRIWALWNANRDALEMIYDTLPTSIFQADLNSSNMLADENGCFAGVMDFNLCGREVLLNYLFREIRWDDDETELKMLLSALSVVQKYYSFTETEKKAALMIYRCVKPLWYIKLMRLTKAGTDLAAIEACLNETEYALVREIDFFPETAEIYGSDI